MKKNYNFQTRISLIIAAVLISIAPRIVYAEDTVTMGQSYANDVFYSMKTGTVQTVSRTNWDIAFSTQIFSASIITNDGSGVELFVYPGSDTSGWASLDTAGLWEWPKLLNDEQDWETGAFNVNASGHPDYGWGIYNAFTHNVMGDSIYVIKLGNGSFKKIWIQKKESLAATYYFRYANLDGTSEENVVLNATPYNTKNFIYYSIVNNTSIDREPASESWDLLFTKYMAVQPNGAFYSVTGVLDNYGTQVSRFDSLPRVYNDWSAKPFDTLRAVIGWDWKVLNGTTFTYDIVDSLVFFVNDQEGDVYKILFNKFAGSSASGQGRIMFTKELLSLAGIEDPLRNNAFQIFPNPGTGTFEFNAAGKASDIRVYDILGNLVYENLSNLSGKMDLTGLTSGTYLVMIETEGRIIRDKLIIQK